jgi:hypothetical protein
MAQAQNENEAPRIPLPTMAESRTGCKGWHGLMRLESNAVLFWPERAVSFCTDSCAPLLVELIWDLGSVASCEFHP